MIGNWTFSETSPASAMTVASSQPVANSAGYFPNGVCGPLDDFYALGVAAEITGATGGTLDVYLQTSPDGGLNFYDVIHFPQALAGATVKYYQSPLSLSSQTTTAVQVGRNLSPAIAVGVVANGAFGDRCRLVMVAGAGTSLGAPVVVRITAQRRRARET